MSGSLRKLEREARKAEKVMAARRPAPGPRRAARRPDEETGAPLGHHPDGLGWTGIGDIKWEPLK